MSEYTKDKKIFKTQNQHFLHFNILFQPFQNSNEVNRWQKKCQLLP